MKLLPASKINLAAMTRRISKILPFDILVLIFEQYVSEETPKHPTETLLLVCRSWSRAALDHSPLWCKFNIRSEDFQYWCTRIPARLKRRSTNTLLDIKITFGPSHDMYESVLSLLAGNEGDIARHWRKFEILGSYDYIYADDHPYELDKFLRFPTPNLCELILININSEPIFPDAPVLKVISAFNSFIELPDLSSVSELYVNTSVSFESQLPRAFNLVTLHIYPADAHCYYHLPSTLRNLTVLRLSELLLKDALEGFSAPALQELHLDFGYGSEFSYVADCRGIPLSHLREISLGSPQRTLEPDVRAYKDGLRKFLGAATHIKILRLIDRASTALVLKLLTSDCESLYQEHPVLLNSGGYEIELGREDRLSSVNKLRAWTQNIRNATWEETFADLKDIIR
jgi:hypothetical protein